MFTLDIVYLNYCTFTVSTKLFPLPMLKISHDIFKNYSGSSTVSSNSELVSTTIAGPSDTLRRDWKQSSLGIETRVRHFPPCKPFENMAVAIVNKILDIFVLKEAEQFRSITVTAYTNTFSLSMLCNSVLVACLDAGIPLREMFYCVGHDDLFVFSAETVVAYHSFGFIPDGRKAELEDELKHVKECIQHVISDVFNIE